jgi:DNA helicase HerA-like ATPase
MLDEADLYLPASAKPATKEPLESLLRRARSAGLGVFLATQSPGGLDYRARDNIGTWMLWRIQQAPAIQKLRPLLIGLGADISDELASPPLILRHVRRQTPPANPPLFREPTCPRKSPARGGRIP